MKIAIIGGHLSPALCVIEELDQSDEVVYVGRKHALEGDSVLSLEYKTINDRKITFEELKTGRLQRKATRHTVTSLLRTPAGLFSALKILRKYRPDVVLGFGSYLEVPLSIAAFILGIPVVIHEQTQEAGLGNKISSKFAKKVLISFESSEKFFPKNKTILTGNPVRQDILNPKEINISDNDFPVIYVTGGSLGSHSINLLVEQNLDKLLEKYVLIHQTGGSEEYKDFERLKELKEKLPNDLKQRYILSKLVDPEKIGGILNKADLVVSRSGINTVTELISTRKPSFLIPLPFAQKEEQLKNAQLLQKLGLGEVREQEGLTSQEFVSVIDSMIKNISSYKIKDESFKLKKDSAKKIIDEVRNTAKTAYKEA